MPFTQYGKRHSSPPASVFDKHFLCCSRACSPFKVANAALWSFFTRNHAGTLSCGDLIIILWTLGTAVEPIVPNDKYSSWGLVLKHSSHYFYRVLNAGMWKTDFKTRINRNVWWGFVGWVGGVLFWFLCFTHVSQLAGGGSSSMSLLLLFFWTLGVLLSRSRSALCWLFQPQLTQSHANVSLGTSRITWNLRSCQAALPGGLCWDLKVPLLFLLLLLRRYKQKTITDLIAPTKWETSLKPLRS